MGNLWLMPIFYVITIAIETPVLCIGLSPQHPMSRRIFSGIWLTACTYPFVWLVTPQLFDPETDRLLYLALAESVAHFGECLLFWLAFRPLQYFWRDMAAVFAANLASFGLGEVLGYVVVEFQGS
jgi:hypothetical protein